jgi:hypothetical protein
MSDRQLNTQAFQRAEKAQAESRVLPEGIYPATVIKEEITTTKSGQLMATFTLAPHNQSGTPVNMKSVRKLVLLPFCDDKDKWEAATAEKLVSNSKIQEKYADFGPEQAAEAYWEDTEARCSSFDGDAVKFVRACLGTDEIPYAKEEDARIALVQKALDVFAGIEDGVASLVGNTLVIRVEHGEFNGQKQAEVKAVYNELPKGKELSFV